jgi:hypothetical protein
MALAGPAFAVPPSPRLIAKTPPGGIEGTVTGTAGPISGAEVTLWRMLYGEPTRTASTLTDADGHYGLAGLVPDEYRLQFRDHTWEHVSEFHEGTSTLPAASDVLVSSDATTVVDAQLAARAPSPLLDYVWQRTITSGDYYDVRGVAVDESAGVVYVAGWLDYPSIEAVSKYDLSTGSYLGELASLGIGPEFDPLRGVAVDTTGNVLVLEALPPRIQRFAPSGGFVTSWMLDGSIAHGLDVDGAGNVYVANTYDDSVVKFDPSGAQLGSWWALSRPFDVAVDPVGGDIFSSHSLGTSMVCRYSPSGSPLTEWGGYGTTLGDMADPSGVDVGPNGVIYVADNVRLIAYEQDGTYVDDWRPYADGSPLYPEDLAVLSDGRIVVVSADGIVAEYATEARLSGTVTDGSTLLENMTVDAYRWSGSAWQSEATTQTKPGGDYSLTQLRTGSYRLRMSDPGGQHLTRWWPNATSEASATTLELTAGLVEAGKDVTLPAAPGTISGTVTGGAGNLTGIKVHAYRQDGSNWIWTKSALTSSGSYTLSGLVAGTYRLWFQDRSGAWSSEYYENIGSFGLATGVTVTAGATTTADADLLGAGTISGTVTGGAGNLSGIKVHAYKQDGANWIWTRSALTASGAYNLTNLPAGTYRLWFQDQSGAWASEYHSDTVSFGVATPVTVTAGGTTTADADLVGAGTISGTVTGGAGNLSGIKVHAYKQDGSNWIWMKSALTSSGAYSLANLPAGTYRLWFYDPTATWGSEYYENVASFGLATGVTVTAGGTTTIDADLAAP